MNKDLKEDPVIDEKDIQIKGLCSEDGKDDEHEQQVFRTVGRPAYVHVDLDAIESNLNVLRECAKNPKIVVMAMVKANAFGHGAVPVAHHLKSLGVERLGVATTEEGFQLRQAGITGPIHVFGNLQGWELPTCINYNLVASVSTIEAIIAMRGILKELTPQQCNEIVRRNTGLKVGTVHIKLDTGLSMNGCKPEELPGLIKLCRDLKVPIEGIFTHLANSEDDEFSRKQMNTFNAAIEPYRDTGIIFHAASSAAILTGVGTDLDVMRTGRALFGLTPANDLERFLSKGLKPAASVHGQVSQVKHLSPGSHVGYGGTYVCEDEVCMVNIPVGFGDFYPLELSNKGVVIRKRTGERCPVIGAVSIDAITVKVNANPQPIIGESFTLLSADYDPETSGLAMANTTGRSYMEIPLSFKERLPRYYTKHSQHYMLWSLTSQLD